MTVWLFYMDLSWSTDKSLQHILFILFYFLSFFLRFVLYLNCIDAVTLSTAGGPKTRFQLSSQIAWQSILQVTKHSDARASAQRLLIRLCLQISHRCALSPAKIPAVTPPGGQKQENK